MRLIRIDVSGHDPELVADRCWTAGATGIWEHADDEWRVGVDDEHLDALWATVADHNPRDVTDELAVNLATRRVTIDLAGHSLTVDVPPTVFGDGTHPTTRGCAAALSAVLTHAAAGARVLDVGCGSGLLAIVAALHGAKARAVDIDPAAVETTVGNAARAGVEVDADTTPVAELAGRFDVVVANIVIGELRPLLGAIVDRVADGGRLVVAGMLEEQWPAVETAIGLTTESVEVDDGWVTATLVR